MEDLRNALSICKNKLVILENHNIALKTQLAHILQYHFDRSLLEKLEYFHTVFLQQDTRFEALRSEMALQERYQLHLQEKLDNMEKDVQRLMTTFSDYLHINFPTVILDNPIPVNKL
jgi:hypothetical protein